jgi:Fe(3+) dicitrate transport protein
MRRRVPASVFALLAIVIAAVWASAARAEDTRGDEPARPEPREAEVRIIGSKADALQRIPGSTAIVTPAEIRRARPQSTGEMLRRVPGLTVRTEDPMGLRLNVGIRGLDSTRSARTLVLEDGVPIALNPYAEPDLYHSTPLERVRAIEVVKGSGSILYGPQSVAGVVNFLTVAPPSRESWFVDAQVGEYARRRVVASYGNAHEQTRYLLQLAHKGGEGPRDMAYVATDLLGKVSFATSERGEATAKIAIYDEVSDTTYAGLTQPLWIANARAPTVAPHDRFFVRRYDAALTHQHAFGVRTHLRTLLFAHATSRIAARQDLDRAPAAGVAYERREGPGLEKNDSLYFRNTNTIRDRAYEVAGVEPTLEHRFATGTVEHTVTAGARFMIEGARRRQATGGTPTSVSGAVTADERDRTLAFAGYLQDRLAFRDDLLVTPGVRLEHAAYNRRMVRDTVAGVTSDTSAEGSSSATAVLTGIGMVVGSPRLHGFAGLHTGFAPPRITSAVTSSGRDMRLEAERSTNYEIGARARMAELVRLEATGFVVSFRNQIVASTPAFGGQSELVNGGATRHLGAEGAGTLLLGPALGVPGSLDLSARYTHVRATFAGGRFDGNALPYAPTHVASAVLDLDLRNGAGAQAAWNRVSSQFADEANTEEPDASGRVGRIPAYDVVDLGLRYRYRPAGLTASLLVKNALDSVYIASRRPDGIFTAGFRQVMGGLRIDGP